MLKSFLSALLCLLLTGLNLQSYQNVMKEREQLISPVADEAVKGMLSGSFLQNWLAIAFTEEDWDTEFSKMKDLGMKYLILDTMMAGEPLYSTDPAVEDDLLSVALKYARKHGIQLIVGLTGGTGVYYGSSEAFTNILTPWAEPFAEFHTQDLAQATKIMNDILEKYGEMYDDTIYGWYFAHEFFNNPLYSKAAWQSIGRQIHGYIEAIENSGAPDKPLVLSPYYLIGIPNIRPNHFVRGLKTLFAEAKVRPQDVFMPQDGYGTDTKHLPVDVVVPSLLEPWIKAMAGVAAEFGVTFWINNEAFTSADISTRPPEQLAMQMLATDQYAQTHFLFSWNHYYSATYYKEKAELEQRFADIFAPG